MNCLALYFLAVPLMWEMLHKHPACQDKKLLLGEPTLVCVLEDRTEVFAFGLYLCCSAVFV